MISTSLEISQWYSLMQFLFAHARSDLKAWSDAVVLLRASIDIQCARSKRLHWGMVAFSHARADEPIGSIKSSAYI